MKESWDKAYAYLISPSCEGFESQLTGDHGGYTVFGISSHWYPGVVASIKHALEAGDHAGALKITEDFYHENYWLPEGCDDMATPLDIYVFVEAVNTEGARCHKMRDLAKMSGSPQKFLDACLDHYKGIVEDHPDQGRFLKGWQNRLDNLAKAFPA